MCMAVLHYNNWIFLYLSQTTESSLFSGQFFILKFEYISRGVLQLFFILSLYNNTMLHSSLRIRKGYPEIIFFSTVILAHTTPNLSKFIKNSKFINSF